MSLICDLCTEVYTAKAQVKQRTTIETDDGHIIDLCYDCSSKNVGELTAEQLEHLVDAPR